MTEPVTALFLTAAPKRRTLMPIRKMPGSSGTADAVRENLETLREVKASLARITAEDMPDPDETLDALTEALDAIDDAIDILTELI